jgi:hypothetical protein
MREIRHFLAHRFGVARPNAGPRAPIALALAVLSALSAGCDDAAHEESLPPVQVGMTKDIAPFYDDGELTIYEVKKGIAFPILAPDDAVRGALNDTPVEPYGRTPWITTDDVEVQVTWTLSNLDDEQHVVEMLVDPWNEFGRYYPGLQLTDADNEEFMPNFSGIDKRYIVPGKGAGDSSRVHGTYTFTDLEEMATDLATVMGIIKDPPPAAGGDEDEEDPRIAYANHAFHWQNRSEDDALVRRWVPATVAGLTGLDLGFRTYEPATVAIEVAIELVDKNGKRVKTEDSDADARVLPPTDEIITVGSAP